MALVEALDRRHGDGDGDGWALDDDVVAVVVAAEAAAAAWSCGGGVEERGRVRRDRVGQMFNGWRRADFGLLQYY